MIIIPEMQPTEWLDELKDFQKRDIKLLLESTNNNYDEAILLYLNADGVSNTVKFGGEKSTTKDSSYIERVKQEMHSFICGDPKYNEYYNRIKNTMEPTKLKTTIVTIITIALHGTLGVSVAFLYPVIIILLMSVTAIGVNAYCASNN